MPTTPTSPTNTASTAPGRAPGAGVESALIEVKPQGQGELEVSFVMPCLNEAATIEACVRSARRCIEDNGLVGEVVVGDNGLDGRVPGAGAGAGARVVAVPMRGYGAAVMGAIDAAGEVHYPGGLGWAARFFGVHAAGPEAEGWV